MGEDLGNAERNPYYVDETVLLPISPFLIDSPREENWDMCGKPLHSLVHCSFPLTEEFSTIFIL